MPDPAGGRAVLAINLLDESDGLADGHDVLPLLGLSVPSRYNRFKSVVRRVGAIDVRVGSNAPMTAGAVLAQSGPSAMRGILSFKQNSGGPREWLVRYKGSLGSSASVRHGLSELLSAIDPRAAQGL